MVTKAGGVLMRKSNAETRADKVVANADGRNMPGKDKLNSALESFTGGHK